MNSENIKKIAVIRRNGFGDFICTVPLIKHLENCYPNAEITLFVDKRNHSLVPFFFRHMKTVVIDGGNKYLALIKTALKYRSENFDMVISVKTSPMKLNNLFLALLGGRHRFAIVDEKSWHSRFINQPRPQEQFKQGHQALNCLRILNPEIKSLPSDLYPKIQLDKHTNEKLTQSSPYLFLSVSNNRAACSLAVSTLASLANGVYKNVPFSVIISYLGQDKNRAIELHQSLDMDSHIYETPDLNSFLSLLNSADVVLVGDGGTCHFAACLNKKLIALYAVTILERWGPLSDSAVCLSDPTNVNNIPMEEIAKAVEHFIRLSHAEMQYVSDNSKTVNNNTIPHQELASPP
ncbi:glycosyltransferase family 9 protein [Budvicia diplopodorum]|uniref:glycosyltransferase family 9 protein n=1 Tax=Budvicia diplopodorum TaxID=1119056 RepID=UPI00135AB45F|nr:glycosyltransferase family 9 protein [Budvicia diplopodorum]